MRLESRHLGNRRHNNHFIIRALIMAGMLLALVMLMYRMSGLLKDEDRPVFSGTEASEVSYWPQPYKELIHHSTFTLSYDEAHEQAEWVAYVLRRDSLNLPRIDRTDWFEPDEWVSTGSAEYSDYTGSGWSRGHLIPSADRAWNREVNAETFLMSNISPQRSGFNAGIWRELEENVRDWAHLYKELYIVTGPIFQEESPVIGKNKVSVPSGFFKAVLDFSSGDHKAIAFLIPNETSTSPLQDYMMTVREVEEVTGFDFFREIINDKYLEDLIESNADIEAWPIDEKRFRRRIEEWNP